MIKYTKLKWLQLKGFDQTAAARPTSSACTTP